MSGRPDTVALSPDERTLYVGVRTAAPVDDVAVLDTATNVVTRTIPVGQRPRGFALTRDGRTLWIADAGYTDSASTSVSVVDTSGAAPTRTVAVGVDPQAVALTPDDRLALVPDVGDAVTAGTTVSVIDTGTLAVVATIPVAGTPAGVAISPDGRTAWIASSGTSAEPDGAVTVVDIPTRTVRSVIRATQLAPYDVAVSPDGSRVLALTANIDDFRIPASISVIDPATNRVTATAGVATEADSVRFAPDGRQAYITTGPGMAVVDVP